MERCQLADSEGDYFSQCGWKMRYTLQLPQVNAVDYLLTWSRHIANPEIQRGLAAHLEDIGLSLSFICPPKNYLEKKMWNDGIVDEVRAIRDAHAAKFGYDLQYFEARRKKQKTKSTQRCCRVPQGAFAEA